MRALLIGLLLGLTGTAFAQPVGTGTAAFCERHGCSEPASCPEVQCGPTTVAVTACPAVKFPQYQRCKRLQNGRIRCPVRRAPRRVLVPIVPVPRADR